MSINSINSLTIDALKQPFSFGGEFVMVDQNQLTYLFSFQNSFKTKFYTLLLVEEGFGNVMIDNEIFTLEKNRVYFVNYNQVFCFSEVDQFKGVALIFTRSFYNVIYTGNKKIKDDTAFLNLPSFIDISKSDFLSFKPILSDIKKEFTREKALRQEIICLLLKVLMLKYTRNTEAGRFSNLKTDRKFSYLNDFKNLVELNFKDLKRTSEYAAQLTITANYLNALVKEKMDISAENFIQNRVILEAERLLLNTNLSVTEIAYELGFSDKSHFGKYFKRISEISPNQFRRKLRGD
ncbi:AraC family transcriptional regulator [Chryseobacterium sp. MP_3.2]|uniref:AraC family transcriptional regulator n=1 Tax=Chryseobacterium sp. MP_3.2 TaxID=3071712 RepID=UPI002E03E50C|nr:AraC family transcriptional activator of pobA [Chryseobacterium sp. MP_3.2]